MGQVRVDQLARDLGVEWRSVLTACHGLGEFVLSEASLLEPSVADQVRAHLVPASIPGPRREGPGRELPMPARLVEEWARQGFEPARVLEWLRAGLRAHEAYLAAACRDARIAPSELARRVDGLSVLNRLRTGESVACVTSRLRAPVPASRPSRA